MRLTLQMRNEAARYRKLADRLEAMANELDAEAQDDLVSSSSPPPSALRTSTTTASDRRFRTRGGKISTRQRVVELLEEGPREWTAAEITEELARRGHPPFNRSDTDRTKNVRNALSASADDVNKLDSGRYLAARFAATNHSTSKWQNQEKTFLPSSAISTPEPDEEEEPF